MSMTVAWWPGRWGGGGGSAPPVTCFRGANIRNCQCEMLYKYVTFRFSTSLKIAVILAFLIEE